MSLKLQEIKSLIKEALPDAEIIIMWCACRVAYWMLRWLEYEYKRKILYALKYYHHIQGELIIVL